MRLPAKAPFDGWIYGVDTSLYQGTLNCVALVEAGVSFAWHKATDGERHVDPQWARSSESSAQAGLPFAPYGVLHPSQDTRKQAENFLHNVRSVEFQLPPMLDFELAHGVTALAALEAASMWLDIVEDGLGRGCVVYTGPSFIKGLAKLSGAAGAATLLAIARRPAVEAHYTQDFTKLPAAMPPWPTWTVWQASGSHKDKDGNVICANACQLPGTNTDVDVDFFRGTIEELIALGAADVTPPAAPVNQSPTQSA